MALVKHIPRPVEDVVGIAEEIPPTTGPGVASGWRVVTDTEAQRLLLGPSNGSEYMPWEMSRIADYCYDHGYRPGTVVVSTVTRYVDQFKPETWGLIISMRRWKEPNSSKYFPLYVKWVDGTDTHTFPQNLLIVQPSQDYQELRKALMMQRGFWNNMSSGGTLCQNG